MFQHVAAGRARHSACVRHRAGRPFGPTPRAAGLAIVSSPHNPTGKVLTETDWNALAEGPKNVRSLLRSCLEKDPERRMSGMPEIIEFFDRAHIGHQYSATTPNQGREPISEIPGR